MSSIVKVDAVGRICIPKSIRSKADLKQSGLLTIDVEDGKIVMEKCNSNVLCKHCGAVIQVEDKFCSNCGSNTEVKNGEVN